MPEGDTIWRIAVRLDPAIAGRELIRFEAARLTGPRPALGRPVQGAKAVGKHLLVRFGDGVVLDTHLRMTGSWHLYAGDARWQRPAHLARAVVGVPGWTAVCFAAPVVRTFHEGQAGPSPVDHLGPDLAAEHPDLDEAATRFAARADGDTLLCDHLLDQRVSAGIGNVYKNELLWLSRLHPLVRAQQVPPGTVREMLEGAHRLLRVNIDHFGDRITVPQVPGGLAVYGRARQPCPRCGTLIERADLGANPRSCYWCPACQPHPDGPAR